MTSRTDVKQLNRVQQTLVTQAQRELGKLWAETADMLPAARRDALLELIPALVRKYGDVGSQAAAEWYDLIRGKWLESAGAGGTFTAQSYTPDYVDDELTQTIRAYADALFPENTRGAVAEDLLRFINSKLDKWIKQAARDTIVKNAQRDPHHPRYARVPSGAVTCAFCSMLASRGFEYASAETAGALRKYHSDCDCEIVPEWDSDAHIEGYKPAELYADYENARKAALSLLSDSRDLTEYDILNQMRKHVGKYTDSLTSETL